MQKWIVVISVMLLQAPNLFAVNIHGLYLASCNRELGVILKVDSRSIGLLTLDGVYKEVPRYEVIYTTLYPLDSVPIEKIQGAENVPVFRIMTEQSGKIVELLRGWPIDFSADKISFLTTEGTETVIDKNAIWKIENLEKPKALNFSRRTPRRLQFVHPYVFASCPNTDSDSSGSGSLVKIFPDQLLSDLVLMKREFDRLGDGHGLIQKYLREQQFYAVPQLYKNRSSLGLWITYGSRYGSSSNRKNNFTPVLVDEFSSGPFGFQQQFSTGSGPLSQGLLEEAQTHVFYRFKADYFHMSMMADPSLLLVGSKYNWQNHELNSLDLRWIEKTFLELGFDYQRVAFEFYLVSVANTGARFGDNFFEGDVGLSRFGLIYHTLNWKFQAIIGAGKSSDGEFSAKSARINFEWLGSKSYQWMLSYLNRDWDFDGFESSSANDFKVDGNSKALVLYNSYFWNKRYTFSQFLGYERVDLRGGLSQLTESKSENFIKAGAMVSLAF